MSPVREGSLMFHTSIRLRGIVTSVTKKAVMVWWEDGIHVEHVPSEFEDERWKVEVY